MAERANIHKTAKKGISFEMLRWTAAARDFRGGMDPVRQRQKLGISEVTWKETERRLKELTGVN